MEYCFDLIIIGLKNIIFFLEYNIENDVHFVYIITYLGKILVNKWEEKLLWLEDSKFEIEKTNYKIHVGGINSPHNQVVKNKEDLMKQKQQIQSVFVK